MLKSSSKKPIAQDALSSKLNRRDFIKLGLGAGAGAFTLLAQRGTPITFAWAKDDSLVQAADLIIKGIDFGGGIESGTAVNAQGLQLRQTTSSGSYLSPILETPIPFSAIVPQWLAEQPTGGAITLQLRTANRHDIWSDWITIQRNDDWTRPEDDDIVGDMLTVPAADDTHVKIQYAVQLNSTTATSPRFHELRFTCIDASAGPTAPQLTAMRRSQAIVEEAASYPKPTVVSRHDWCDDPACDYSDGLEYRSVTHLIVHHTVTSNSSSNWAAVVRAIWYFHTFTRGWGDIGYNYLVDMNGVIYEGHLGGDDVIGTHAGDANSGSMALAFIGTFTEADHPTPGITPPSPMLTAAADLFAWKADQKNIDLYESSYLPNMNWGLPHIMGHRDVYGTTSCPGDQLHDLLPWLRAEVAQRIGFVAEDIFVDSNGPNFSKSRANWYNGPYDCGFNGHAYYTYSTTNPAASTNWGEWQLPIPYDGRYEVAVYAPYCNTGRGDTAGARYELYHANGVDTIVVNQGEHLGIWVSLGEFLFLANGSHKLHLSDLTTTDDDLGVWFDAVRLRPLAPEISMTHLQPAADGWQLQTAVNFNWTLNDPAVVSTLRLEVSADANFNTLLLTETVAPTISTLTVNFEQDQANLYWRLVATTQQNETVISQPTRFGIDTTPPTSTVGNIFFTPRQNNYLVQVTGSDATSGVATYNIDYRPDGETTWQTWQTATSDTTHLFTPPNPNAIYWFRTQAIDQAGNSEPSHEVGDASTANATLLDNELLLPLIRQEA